ncbi:MAG: helix-turn-helix domain-containing protein [Acidobacteria bacterium]|nr:helix-turn-helix domain-containing protein [Acidobacteriota bacterium]
MKEEYISAEEAAKSIGLHPATLRKLAWQRRIRSFKVLGALRFKRSDLEELVVERPKEESNESKSRR